MTKNTLKYFINAALVAGAIIGLPVMASSSDTQSFDGIIKGAECHLYNQLCDEQSSGINHYFEKDFVLVSGEKYFLLDNLPLEQKRRLNNQSVRITGDLDQQHISVSNIKSNIHGQYKDIWDWDDIQYELYEN